MSEQYTQKQAHDFWKNPDKPNKPEEYLKDAGQSKYLSWLAPRYVAPTESVLEIGCNVGRNLHALHTIDGYKDLHGVEINEHAADVFAMHFPETFATTHLKIGAAEDIIPQYPAQSFGLVYTVAVLEHMSNESQIVAINMVRILKKHGVIITIEDEAAITERHFPRNYKTVFEDLGLKQVFSEYTPVEMGGAMSKFVTRVFTV